MDQDKKQDETAATFTDEQELEAAIKKLGLKKEDVADYRIEGFQIVLMRKYKATTLAHAARLEADKKTMKGAGA